MFKNIDSPDLYPPHPGEILREDILPHIGLPRRELARHLGMSPHALTELLNERRAVTLDIARRLGTALGQGARYWLGLQAQYDLWRASEPVAQPVKPLAWGRMQVSDRR